MADQEHTTAGSRKPWALTFFGLLAAGGLIAMPFLAGPPDGDKMPDIMRFLGHFHPVVLHLPIGVFAMILFQELGAIFGRRHHDHLTNPSLFPLFFGAASAIVAVIAGFLLYQSGVEYEGNALAERHLWGGLVFAVAAVLTFIFKAWTVAVDANPAFYRLLLFGSVGVMGFASHDGASITHGESYLTDYAPDPIRKILGLKPKAAKKGGSEDAPASKPGEQLVYADIVSPILERRCVSCHKEGKAKGKFQMDSYERLVQGGKEGDGLEPGNAAESNIVIRMELRPEDEDHMPPEGKPDIEDSELSVVKWWIDNGADPKKSLAEFVLPAPIQEAISKLIPAGAASESDVADVANPHDSATGPDDELKASVAELSKEFPGALNFESQKSALVTFTAVSLRGKLDDEGFKKLESLSQQFVTVDLSATKITDEALSQLSSAKNLRLIRLAETNITDASIDTLLKIPTLESINLYGTKVTDAGVSKLSSMPGLKRLYLWQTAVTPEAIKTLREKLPECEIITGIES